MEKEETSDSFDNARPVREGLRTGGISNAAGWVAAHVRGVTTKIGCIKFLQPAEPVKQSLKTNWPSSTWPTVKRFGDPIRVQVTSRTQLQLNVKNDATCGARKAARRE